jgi:UDP-N-acetylglucosamine acyltransferase
MSIDSSAVIDPAAEIEGGVTIGPFCVVRGPVRIGAGSVLHERASVHAGRGGRTVLGRDCQVGPGALVGGAPQHLAADPEVGWCVLEDGVVVREGASVHRATKPGEPLATRVGRGSFLMGATHVAHDCVLADAVILANGALLGGHCTIGTKAFLGGGCTIHQHVRVGRLAIIAGNEAVSQDVPPFAAVRYGRIKAYNAVGCRRAGVAADEARAIRAFYHRLAAAASPRLMAERVAADPGAPHAWRELADFILASRRGLVPSRRAPAGTAAEHAEVDA